MTTTFKSLMLATVLCIAPLVSMAQIVNSCSPVADTSQPELAVCSASGGTNFLVGVRGHINGADIVGAQLLSADGNRTPQFIDTGRVMDGFLDGPRVGFGADQYILTWTDAASQHPATGNDVYAQFISVGGTLIGTPFPVSEAPGDQAARGAAFDGTNYLVIWAAADGLRGREVSTTGTLLEEELLLTAADVEEAAAVAYGGGRYFVVWVEGTDGTYAAKGRLVPPSGHPGPVLSLSQTNSHFYNPISVAFGEDRFFAVWHHNVDENAGWDLRGRIALPNGTLQGDEFEVTAEPDDEFAWAKNVVFDGTHFLVVWTVAEGNPMDTNSVIWGQYWTSSGVPHSVPFIIDNTSRSKLGLGLSGTDGRVLTVIDVHLLVSDADVCARVISRPTISMTLAGPHSIQITYSGVLQYSTNLTDRQDSSPQPVSPWTTTATDPLMFFRAR